MEGVVSMLRARVCWSSDARAVICAAGALRARDAMRVLAAL